MTGRKILHSMHDGTITLEHSFSVVTWFSAYMSSCLVQTCGPCSPSGTDMFSCSVQDPARAVLTDMFSCSVRDVVHVHVSDYSIEHVLLRF